MESNYHFSEKSIVSKFHFSEKSIIQNFSKFKQTLCFCSSVAEYEWRSGLRVECIGRVCMTLTKYWSAHKCAGLDANWVFIKFQLFFLFTFVQPLGSIGCVYRIMTKYSKALALSIAIIKVLSISRVVWVLIFFKMVAKIKVFSNFPAFRNSNWVPVFFIK